MTDTMSDAVPSARRQELLDAAYRYVLTNGAFDLSLRPLTASPGTSPWVLLYLFGSKDGLVREILTWSLVMPSRMSSVPGGVTHSSPTRSTTLEVRRICDATVEQSLPQDVDVDKIDANLTDGVLTVRVPKSDAAKPRRIKITGS